jgi:hypothetical protein
MCPALASPGWMSTDMTYDRNIPEHLATGKGACLPYSLLGDHCRVPIRGLAGEGTTYTSPGWGHMSSKATRTR